MYSNLSIQLGIQIMCYQILFYLQFKIIHSRDDIYKYSIMFLKLGALNFIDNIFLNKSHILDVIFK